MLAFSTDDYMLMNYLDSALKCLYAMLPENKFLVWIMYQYELCDKLKSVIR